MDGMSDDTMLTIIIYIIIATATMTLAYTLEWGSPAAFLAGFIAAVLAGEIVKAVIE